MNSLDKSFAKLYRPDLLGPKYYSQEEIEKLGEEEYFRRMTSHMLVGRLSLGGMLVIVLLAGVSGLCKLITEPNSATTSVRGMQYMLVEVLAGITLIRGWRFGHTMKAIDEET